MKRLSVLIVTLLPLLLTLSCDGVLHDTAASFIKVEIINLPAPSGVYSLAGTFGTDPWNNTTRTFSLSNGSGSYDGSTDTPVFEANLAFTIVPKGSWDRPWLGPTKGNDSSALPANGGFKLTIPMDGDTHTITIDGGTNPATLKIDGVVVE